MLPAASGFIGFHPLPSKRITVSCPRRKLVMRLVGGKNDVPIGVFAIAVEGTSYHDAAVVPGPPLKFALFSARFTHPLIPYPKSMIIAPLAPLPCAAAEGISPVGRINPDPRRSKPSLALATLNPTADTQLVSISALRIDGHTSTS